MATSTGGSVSGSTVPRRQLGRYLRELRTRENLTVRTAAEKLEWSEAKIWRIETGQTSLRSLDVEAMCRIYRASPDITEALMGLAKATKARGWWHAYADAIPEGYDVYLGLEEAASEFCWYEPELVPDLLQTEDYARTVISAGTPAASPTELDRRVQLRMMRQELIHRESVPPDLRVALSEGILRRPVGGAAVMSAQLDRLAQMAELPNVDLRVIPFAVGLHPGVLCGPFSILRFPRDDDGRESEPPMVYVDGLTQAQYLDKPAEAERYTAVFAGIWDASLAAPASLDLIRHAASQLRR